MNTLEAYGILLQKQKNEDRLLMERTTVFILACSFLFVGFVEVKEEPLLRIAAGALGILLSFAIFYLNQAAVNAIQYFLEAQRQLEHEPDFLYMRIRSITPNYDGLDCINGRKELQRDQLPWAWNPVPISKWKFWRRVPKVGSLLRLIPILFWGLWIFALVRAFSTPIAN